MSRRGKFQAIGALVAIVLVGGAARWLLGSDVAGSEGNSRAAPVAAPDATVFLPVAEPTAPASALLTEAQPAAEPPAAPDAGAAPSGPGMRHRFTGRVLDASGAPFAGARLFLVPDVDTLKAAGLPLRGSSRLADVDRDSLASTTSGDDGRFELSGRLVPRRPGETSSYDSPGDPVLLVQANGFALLGHVCRDLRGDAYDTGDLELSPGFTVEGVVTDADSRPLPGARVVATVQHGWTQAGRPPVAVEYWWYATLTEDSGRYELASLPELPLTLVASAEGYIPGKLAVQPQSGLSPEHDFTLALGATVSGTVIDRDGHPVPGARVALLDVSLAERGTSAETWSMDLNLATGREGGVGPDGREIVLTNSEGRFVLTGLPQQNLTLGAAAEGFSNALVYDVAPGLPDVVLVLRPAAELVVHVRDHASGEPLQALLEARRTAAAHERPASWEEALTVVPYGAMPGDYLVRGAGPLATRVQATAPGHASRTMWADGLPPGASGELTIELEPGVSLPGRVADDSGAPVSAAGLRLSRHDDPAHLVLVESSDADGTFRFADLPTGEYGLAVEAPGFVEQHVKALTIGDAAPSPLSITLVRAGDVEGLLLDHRGVAARDFTVDADGPEQGLRDDATTDTSGRFALRDLLPGTWKLSSATSGEVPVEVRAGETSRVELRLAPPSYILGRVTCGGQPVAGAHLLLHAEGMPLVGSDTPADGRFKIQVPARTWTVGVSTDVGGSASTTVDVLTGESRHVDFVLPSGALVVHAMGPHGEPARRALLILERAADPPPGPGADPDDAWEGLAQRFAEEDGVARFAQIAAGPYRVRVGVGGDWVGGEPVVAQVADGAADVTIVLHPAATIAGHVQTADGVPLPKGTMLTLYAATGERQGLRMARIDGDGGFLFDCLEAGSYVVGVYAIPPEHFGDTPALAEQPVTLEEGQQAQVSLTLPAHG